MLRILFTVSISWGYAWASSPRENVLYQFQGGTDGALPSGNLLADKGGNLYGTTSRGGLASGLCQADEGCGTAFQLKPPGVPGGVWTEVVLYRFIDGSDGQGPEGRLMLRNRSLLGTTVHGGGTCAFTFSCGTVFEVIRKRPE